MPAESGHRAREFPAASVYIPRSADRRPLAVTVTASRLTVRTYSARPGSGKAKPADTGELAEVMSEEAARRFSWADGLKRAFRLDLLTGSPASFEHFRKNPEIVGNPSRSAQTIQVAASPDLAPWCAG